MSHIKVGGGRCRIRTYNLLLCQQLLFRKSLPPVCRHDWRLLFRSLPGWQKYSATGMFMDNCEIRFVFFADDHRLRRIKKDLPFAGQVSSGSKLNHLLPGHFLCHSRYHDILDCASTQFPRPSREINVRFPTIKDGKPSLRARSYIRDRLIPKTAAASAMLYVSFCTSIFCI